ncbi:MAG TPA: hypothetical protein VMZ03_01925 [Chitinophagaceae bacterium]|nr:hypothetical protein [Chitinophagaceae bacterium]
MATTNQQHPGPQPDGGNMGGSEQQDSSGLHQTPKMGTNLPRESQGEEGSFEDANLSDDNVSKEKGQQNKEQDTKENLPVSDQPTDSMGDSAMNGSSRTAYRDAINKNQGARSEGPDKDDASSGDGNV